LYFPNDLACVIHNADARLLYRNVQSSKIVHAALLLLMLEAVFTDLVSPSALVSVRKHFESFESFVIQSGDLIREGHHRGGRRRTADVTTAANCDIRVT